MAPVFQTSVMALATLRAPSVRKWSLYDKEKYIGTSGKKVRNKNGG